MPNKKEHKIDTDGIEKKHCPTCDNWKILNEFTKQSSSWDNLCRMCRQCMKEYKRNKRKNDPKYALKDKEYNEKYKTSGRRKQVSRNRYLKKKDQIIKQCMAYQRKKYKNDICFRIASIQRRRMSKLLDKALKGKAYKISKVELIGCTPNELKKYIENQFVEGMCWENYGIYTWHIDHIIPLSKFNLKDPEEVKKAFNFKNLQPLWAKDNLEKSNKLNWTKK